MIKKKTIPLLIALICCLEAVIFLWAFYTTEPEFVFDKCARNSGRTSSVINLVILLMIGYYGFKEIYQNAQKKDTFRVLITLFAFNHLIHFFYVFQNFKHHTMELRLIENLHGFLTFICILIVPVLLWTYKNPGRIFYAGITIHLFNVSYFIMKTFYSKIKPEAPAYHNQLGIVVTTLALAYVVLRFVRENQLSFTSNLFGLRGKKTLSSNAVIRDSQENFNSDVRSREPFS